MRLSGLSRLVMWAALAGCGPGAPGEEALPAPPRLWTDCADASCRQGWALAAWAREPGMVAHHVGRVSDPIEQEMLVLMLAEAHPGQVAALCAALPRGPARQRCEEINGRPHLRADQPGAREISARVPDGVFFSRVSPAAFPNPWADHAPVSAVCPAMGDVHTCQEAAARKAVRAREDAQAAAACNGIASAKWRAECYFQAAEESLASNQAGVIRVSAVPRALALCRGAEPWLDRCFAHVYHNIASQSPPADAPPELAAAGWAKVALGAQTAHDALVEDDPGLAVLFVDRLWADAARRSYAAATLINGAPLDHVDAAAQAHMRAGAAWQLMVRRDPPATWTEAQAALGRALADRQTHPDADPMGPGRIGQRQHLVDSLWVLPETPPVPLLDGVPAAQTHYLGDTLRLVAPGSGEVDADIALVEALGRTEPPALGALGEAAVHPDARVAWSAQRLLSQLAPPAQ